MADIISMQNKMTTAKVAKLLKTHPSSVRRFVAEGRLKAIWVEEIGRYIYDRDTVLEFKRTYKRYVRKTALAGNGQTA